MGLHDRVSGLDLTMESDGYEEFNAYLEDLKAVFSRNVLTAKMNVLIIFRNISLLESRFNLKKTSKYLAGVNVVLSDENLAARKDILSNIDILKKELDDLDEKLKNVVDESTLHAISMGISIERSKFIDIFHKARENQLDFQSPTIVTALYEYEKYPIEPTPPKW